MEFDQNLVKHVAWRVQSQYLSGTDYEHMVSIGDLMHQGVIGFMKARQNFNPDLGEWIPYARLRIRGEMLDSLRKLSIVHMPLDLRRKARELQRLKEELARKGETNSHLVLAEKLGWALEDVYEIEQVRLSFTSTDTSGSPDDSEETGEIRFQVPDEWTPEDEALRQEISMLIQKCLEAIEQKDRLVLVARFLEEVKLRELAAMMGCTVQNVSQGEKRALKKMKTCFESNGWTAEN
jgi:RNA polymerase sigma factor for flagellar operon FliA